MAPQHISEAEMAEYRATLRHRREQERELLAQRRERAWDVARRAAALLKEEFVAEKVVLFGSLLHPDIFTASSDVDIAAYGIKPSDTFKAIGAVLGLDSDIEVNLVDVSTCRASVLGSIDREGVEL
jgi:predicted nucleotidyltransferase